MFNGTLLVSLSVPIYLILCCVVKQPLSILVSQVVVDDCIENTIKMEGKSTKGRNQTCCVIFIANISCYFFGEAFHHKCVGFITVHNHRDLGVKPSKCTSCITYVKK